jgi:hypothetical protein
MPAYLRMDLANITIYDEAFDHVFNEPLGDVGRWMSRRGKAATTFAKARAGIKTGKLKAAIKMAHDRKGPGRQQQIRIGTLDEKGRGYALYHHEGTGPHDIVGKRGRMLVFTYHGKRITTKMVHHPGTKPNHYLTDTFGMFVA